jgi:hypothetical protein
LSRDALLFCDFIAKYFPAIAKAYDRLRASMSRAICVGAARTVNMAIKRSQLASFQGMHFSSIPRVAACEALASHSFGSAPVWFQRDAFAELPYPRSFVPDATRVPVSRFSSAAVLPDFLLAPHPLSAELAPAADALPAALSPAADARVPLFPAYAALAPAADAPLHPYSSSGVLAPVVTGAVRVSVDGFPGPLMALFSGVVSHSLAVNSTAGVVGD